MSTATTQISIDNSVRLTRRIKPRPVLLLTINNGAAHTQAAEAIAEALEKHGSEICPKIVDVSDFMSPLARFTHVTAYLWLVKNAPAVWEKIDAYQKKQTQTSPAWFYRHHCKKIFELAREIQPSAIVATEVGCGEIAALIKKDLKLKALLVAVNLDYDADRAWLQPEVDFYSVATDFVKTNLVELGAEPEKISVLGAPLKEHFKVLEQTARAGQRAKICAELGFETALPIVLVAGGGEGLGNIEQIIKVLLKGTAPLQLVVMTGKNTGLKERCEKIARQPENAQNHSLRVIGWTNNVAEFYQVADILISKLGLTFFEATACALPIVALIPPPGAERVQYNLLEKLGVGRAVKTVEEMAQVVTELLIDERKKLVKMRSNAEKFGQTNAAAPRLANWIVEQIFARAEVQEQSHNYKTN